MVNRRWLASLALALGLISGGCIGPFAPHPASAPTTKGAAGVPKAKAARAAASPSPEAAGTAKSPADKAAAQAQKADAKAEKAAARPHPTGTSTPGDYQTNAAPRS